MDRLARALLSISGLSVTNSQAAEIQRLYSDLHEYDRRPLSFKPRRLKPARGRFARAKPYRIGHVGVEAVIRYHHQLPAPLE